MRLVFKDKKYLTTVDDFIDPVVQKIFLKQ